MERFLFVFLFVGLSLHWPWIKLWRKKKSFVRMFCTRYTYSYYSSLFSIILYSNVFIFSQSLLHSFLFQCWKFYFILVKSVELMKNIFIDLPVHIYQCNIQNYLLYHCFFFVIIISYISKSANNIFMLI